MSIIEQSGVIFSSVAWETKRSEKPLAKSVLKKIAKEMHVAFIWKDAPLANIAFWESMRRMGLSGEDSQGFWINEEAEIILKKTLGDIYSTIWGRTNDVYRMLTVLAVFLGRRERAFLGYKIASLCLDKISRADQKLPRQALNILLAYANNKAKWEEVERVGREIDRMYENWLREDEDLDNYRKSTLALRAIKYAMPWEALSMLLSLLFQRKILFFLPMIRSKTFVFFRKKNKNSGMNRSKLQSIC
jgi:hypothetical protein